MTDQTTSRRRRPRLDAGARERILAEIARLDRRPRGGPRPPLPDLAGLRALLTAAAPGEAEEEAAAAGPGPAGAGAAGATEAGAREAGGPPAAGSAEAAGGAGPEATGAPAGGSASAEPGGARPLMHHDPWSALRLVPVDPARLERNLIITAARTDPAHGAFAVLRARMTQALAERGWRRVAITSPTKGSGKSFTALNLAVALSRYAQTRAVLLDLDMRLPALARMLGVGDAGSIGEMLRGRIAPEAHLRRFGPNALNIGGNVALGLNERVEPFAAELLQAPEAAAAIRAIEARLQPQIILFDLPPALAQDDVIAARGLFDCVLLVVGGGETTPRQVREAVRRIGEDRPILGIVLNKAEGVRLAEYAY